MNRIVSLINRFRAVKYYKDPYYVMNKKSWNELLSNYKRYVFKIVNPRVFDMLNDKNSNPCQLIEYGEHEKKFAEFLESFGDPKLINSIEENFVNKFYELCLSLPKNEFGLFFMYCITMPEYIMFNRIFYEIVRNFDCLENSVDLIRYGSTIPDDHFTESSMFMNKDIEF